MIGRKEISSANQASGTLYGWAFGLGWGLSPRKQDMKSLLNEDRACSLPRDGCSPSLSSSLTCLSVS